jgi:3-hydroxyisobutyrate dehydrogenase-like beta-hydroxyacid dehydrogenase
MKLAVNAMIYGINQCLAEALVLAERGGVELPQAYRAILESAAAAPVVGYRREAFLAPESTPVSFALDLELKDLRLTTDLARELGAPTPQADVNRLVVEGAVAAGYGDRDIASIAQYLKEVTG